MSDTTIDFTFTVNGVPTDATSVVLRDPGGTFGVRRADTLAIVVPAGTAMTRLSAGVYAHTFADPAPNLAYTYWVEAVHGGATHRLQGVVASGGASAGPPSYLSVAAADALAAALPGLAAWAAADAPTKATALARASLDVDGAMTYQGCKYDAGQVLQFPRLPDGAAATVPAARQGSGVWDWDPGLNAAVVPEDVLLAVVLQADANLAGDREARLAAQHDGVVYDLTGSVAESYKQTEGPGVATGLCRPAWVLLRKYRLRSGRVL